MQINLPINLPDVDDSGFLRSDCNSFAVKFISSWLSSLKDLHIAILIGEEKSGKSSLLRLWQANNNAYELKPKKSLESFIAALDENKFFIIDDIKNWKKNEEILFHIVNYINSNKKYLLITSEYRNFEEIFKLKDLISRLRSYTNVEIDPVDEYLARQLLFKNFSRYQIRLKNEIIDFIIENYSLTYSLIDDISKKIIEYIEHNNDKNISFKKIKDILM